MFTKDNLQVVSLSTDNSKQVLDKLWGKLVEVSSQLGVSNGVKKIKSRVLQTGKITE